MNFAPQCGSWTLYLLRHSLVSLDLLIVTAPSVAIGIEPAVENDVLAKGGTELSALKSFASPGSRDGIRVRVRRMCETNEG